MTGVAVSVAPSMRCTCPGCGDCNPSLRAITSIRSGSRSEASSNRRPGSCSSDLALRSQSLDLVSVFDRPEMLQRVSHDQQEQATQRQSKLLHLAFAARIFDFHQARVIDGLAEINFRESPASKDLRWLEKTARCTATALMIYATPNEFRIVFCVFLNGSEPWFCKADSTNDVSTNDVSTDDVSTDDVSTSRGSTSRSFDRRRLLFGALDRGYQILYKGAGKFHCEGSIFSSPDAALLCFFLAAPGKLHHRVCLPESFLYPARLTITAPGARQFLRANPKSFAGDASAYILSAARILALRDRGFRSISSSDAVTGFFVSTRKSIVLRAGTHGILHDPVFERMKADHHQPSPRLQHSGRCLSSAFRSSSSRFTKIRRA
jgi:hypothetical protein